MFSHILWHAVQFLSVLYSPSSFVKANFWLNEINHDQLLLYFVFYLFIFFQKLLGYHILSFELHLKMFGETKFSESGKALLGRGTRSQSWQLIVLKCSLCISTLSPHHSLRADVSYEAKEIGDVCTQASLIKEIGEKDICVIEPSNTFCTLGGFPGMPVGNMTSLAVATDIKINYLSNASNISDGGSPCSLASLMIKSLLKGILFVCEKSTLFCILISSTLECRVETL